MRNVGEWKSGGTPSRRYPEYFDGDIPWIKTGDLNNDYIFEIPEKISKEAVENSSAKILPKNTVLIAMYGATIGKVGITTCEATTNQACCACCNPTLVVPKYLFYYLQSQKENFIYKAIGGAQPNISKEKIVESFIPIPPKEEQHRIIKAIENSNALINSII
jgi:type I restriction enzyme S subunit